MGGESDGLHQPLGSKWAETAKRIKSPNNLAGGFKKVKLSIQYDPYYKEIWGNLLAVSYPLHTVIVI